MPRTATYKKAPETAKRAMVDVSEGMVHWSLGRQSLMCIAKEAGALFYCGRKPLIVVDKMNQYINTMVE